jgi:hypothetical protein
MHICGKLAQAEQMQNNSAAGLLSLSKPVAQLQQPRLYFLEGSAGHGASPFFTDDPSYYCMALYLPFCQIFIADLFCYS